ncbi:MAG: type II secretion system minor pseudopilin GspI [Sulfuriferula sp.]
MIKRCDLNHSGFTLIEVLVALAIISIALLASLRVAGGGTNSVGELRTRLLAGWVAENVLAEQRARNIWLPLGMQQGSERQSGIAYSWREEVISTPNSVFRRVNISVYTVADETHVVAHLVGFISQPPSIAK